MVRKIVASPDFLLEQFSSKKFDEKSHRKVESLKITSSQISDALKKVTGENGVIPLVKPIKNNLKINGRIVTVKTRQDDWGTPLRAIETAQKGDIIFVSCDGDDIAVWGELFSKYAQEKGMGGTVIYGAMRDINAVCDLNYPVFSRAVVPNAGKPKAEGDTNIKLECGGVVVKPGDWIIGDDCGVVVVPENLRKKVIDEAVEIKINEDKILRQLQEGASLSDIVGI